MSTTTVPTPTTAVKSAAEDVKKLALSWPRELTFPGFQKEGTITINPDGSIVGMPTTIPPGALSKLSSWALRVQEAAIVHAAINGLNFKEIVESGLVPAFLPADEVVLKATRVSYGPSAGLIEGELKANADAILDSVWVNPSDDLTVFGTPFLRGRTPYSLDFLGDGVAPDWVLQQTGVVEIENRSRTGSAGYRMDTSGYQDCNPQDAAALKELVEIVFEGADSLNTLRSLTEDESWKKSWDREISANVISSAREAFAHLGVRPVLVGRALKDHGVYYHDAKTLGRDQRSTRYGMVKAKAVKVAISGPISAISLQDAKAQAKRIQDTLSARSLGKAVLETYKGYNGKEVYIIWAVKNQDLFLTHKKAFDVRDDSVLFKI